MFRIVLNGVVWDGMGWGRVRCRVRMQSRCQQDGVDTVSSILQNLLLLFSKCKTVECKYLRTKLSTLRVKI